MNNNALISIIIPAYNTQEYIHRAIESSLRQSYKNIEIIIINDGSTDETLRTAQTYADKDNRIKIFHQENKGVSSARNHGIREARGKYITFLDSDDWFEDDAVEILLAAQLDYPDKIIIANFYNNVKFDNNNEIIRKPLNSPDKASRFVSMKETACLQDSSRPKFYGRTTLNFANIFHTVRTHYLHLHTCSTQQEHSMSINLLQTFLHVLTAQFVQDISPLCCNPR
ncbi:MAG: glycosyltransferase family 2 protein [Synergistaceae bacterium]|nr:glycosyltransferase family 2 protein [Synergistaceae bacterium]